MRTWKLVTGIDYLMITIRTKRRDQMVNTPALYSEVIIIISIHEFRPGWPVSVSAVISSRSLLSGCPGRRLRFG
jgi:hypothetical protein